MPLSAASLSNPLLQTMEFLTRLGDWRNLHWLKDAALRSRVSQPTTGLASSITICPFSPPSSRIFSHLHRIYFPPFYRRPKQRGPGAQAQNQGDSLRQRTAKRARAERVHTKRLASGGSEGESARMSLRGGDSPSTLAVPVRAKDSRLAAKESGAAKERSADHRRVKAKTAAAAAAMATKKLV